MKSAVASIALLGALVFGARNTLAQSSAPDGQALYKQDCATCHGAAGVPAPAMAKAMGIPTFDAALFARVSADSMIAVLKHGQGKAMKSFKDKLTDEQMAAVIKYLRTAFAK